MINKKHLIVVSIDALVYEDLSYAKTLPSFGRILKEGVLIKQSRSVYPTETHTVHASIMSGCTPGKTKIIANKMFEVGSDDRKWYNDLSQMGCETIFHYAKKENLTTAACKWPVTACGGDVIDYLVPEIMGKDVEMCMGDLLKAYKEKGTTENVLDIVKKGLDIYGYENSHPNADDLQIYCSAEIIKKYKPNILFTHPCLVDSMRHKTGLFNDKVNESIKKTDEYLKILFDAVKDAGIEENTDFVILSDHGHMDVSRKVFPNVYLADEGYIKLGKDGNIINYDAFGVSCGLSFHIYLSNPENKTLYNKIYDFLLRSADKKTYGFERVFTKEEVKERYGLDGDFSFVLETDGESVFGDDFTGEPIRELKSAFPGYKRSWHGHMPEKGPQPIFAAIGPSFKRETVFETGFVLDYAPSFAALFGINMSDTDGKVMDFLLK